MDASNQAPETLCSDLMGFLKTGQMHVTDQVQGNPTNTGPMAQRANPVAES